MLNQVSTPRSLERNTEAAIKIQNFLSKQPQGLVLGIFGYTDTHLFMTENLDTEASEDMVDELESLIKQNLGASRDEIAETMPKFCQAVINVFWDSVDKSPLPDQDDIETRADVAFHLIGKVHGNKDIMPADTNYIELLKDKDEQTGVDLWNVQFYTIVAIPNNTTIN